MRGALREESDGNYDKAEAGLQAALAEDPLCAEACFQLSRSHSDLAPRFDEPGLLSTPELTGLYRTASLSN